MLKGGALVILICSHRKPTTFCGLFFYGLPALYGRWRFACVYENRERFYACGDEVEMYVSLSSFFRLLLALKQTVKFVREKRTVFLFVPGSPHPWNCERSEVSDGKGKGMRLKCGLEEH
jgi:hypothetical protein